MENTHLVDLAEDRDTEIPIDDENPDLFETMIAFHYTDQVPRDLNTQKYAVDLLKLADKYGISKLKMHIVEELLSAESCLELLLVWRIRTIVLYFVKVP